MLFVLSAPSGSGKSTIARSILQQFDGLSFSVSATTRAPRPKETDGKDYFFLSREEFERRVAEGGLVEWEEIYGNLYGTLKAEVDRVLADGGHLLFDIDVKGALSIKNMYDAEAVLIFIRPPNMDVLRERLLRRGTDSEEVVERRMQRADWELARAASFDYEVVNDDLQRSVPEVAGIVGSHLRGSQE
ncbi:MAG: guanylate kinase [Bacteroidota bacterium]|nr:guanylate kinase [Bacteroidota bacterium]